ncbi:MAG: flagellar hook-associated protein FlgL [Oscillospiraceae bacterium]
MRITNSMMTNNYLSDLSGNLNRLSKYLEQETTGKAINKISDDPVATIKSLSARNKLSDIERYQGNVDTADSWLTEVESALSELNKVTRSAYEDAVKVSTGTFSDDDLNAIAEEIEQLRDEVLSTANATIGGSYLFAGYNTTGCSSGELPFSVDSNGDLYYNGINMSNEASVDDIGAASDTAAKTLTKALDADNIAQGADITDYTEIYAAVNDAAGYVSQIADAASKAASGAKDISSSADIASTTMGDLLSGLSDAASTAAQEASQAASDAAGAADAAEAAADAADEAYTKWQDSIGTEDESDAYSAYSEATDAANAATEIARTASSTAISKANTAQSATDTINSVINASDSLTSSYAASDGASATAELAALGGDYDAVSAAADTASSVAADAADAGQIFADAAAGIGDTSLAGDIAAAVSAVQTAASDAAAAASVTDAASAATAVNAVSAVQTAIKNLQDLVDGSDALYLSSSVLDSESQDTVTVQVGVGQTMQLSVPGTELLGRGSENLYVILDNLYNSLTSGADTEELNDYISQLQDAQSSILSLDAEVGAKMERLDTLSARYEANITNYTQMKSDAEDADLAEAIMNYSTAKTVYEAALSSGSEVIQTSLIDFLR